MACPVAPHLIGHQHLPPLQFWRQLARGIRSTHCSRTPRPPRRPISKTKRAGLLLAPKRERAIRFGFLSASWLAHLSPNLFCNRVSTG